MVDCFARAGWQVPAPDATMFAWAPLPEPFRHLGSLEFSKLLIEHADVAVARHADMDSKNLWEKLTKYGLRRPAHAEDPAAENGAA